MRPEIVIHSDDIFVVRRLAYAFQNDEQEVYESASLCALQAIVRRSAPHILIADNRMPAANLALWMLQVRSYKPGNWEPIFVILIDADQLEIAKSTLQDEAVHFITRPILPSHLVMKVNELCAKQISVQD